MGSAKQKCCKLFPGLKPNNFAISSPKTRAYNCIAYAAGDTGRWWWHVGAYWPSNTPKDGSIASYRQLFTLLGYSDCTERSYEEGYEKIALFAADGKPTHAARMDAKGQWLSKLGNSHDITHILYELEGEKYGQVAFVMKRPLPAAVESSDKGPQLSPSDTQNRPDAASGS